MSPCEFRPGKTDYNPGVVVCNTVEALPAAQAKNEGAFSIAELKLLLCGVDNPKAREDCPAYSNLCTHGKKSSWAK